MATFRQVHVRMWDNDGKFEELSPSAKLLFIYSWSNGHRNEACLYEITKRKISSETGLDLTTLDRALDELSAVGMVFYDNEKYYLWAVNALKYQSINANNVTAVLRDILACPSVLAKKYAEYWRPALEGYINRWGMAWAWDGDGMPMELDTHTDKGKGNNKGKGNGKDKEKDNHSPPTPQSPSDDQRPPGRSIRKHNGEAKVQYAEFVSLTNAEYSSLVTKLGSDQRAKKAIEVLDNYKGAEPKKRKYDSDYRAILSWVVKRLEEDEAKNGQRQGGDYRVAGKYPVSNYVEPTKKVYE